MGEPKRDRRDLEDTPVPTEHLFFSYISTKHMNMESTGCGYCCEAY